LKKELETQCRKDGVFLPQDQYDKMSGDLLERATKIEELEDLIQIKGKEAQEMQEFFQYQSQELVSIFFFLSETVLITYCFLYFFFLVKILGNSFSINHFLFFLVPFR